MLALGTVSHSSTPAGAANDGTWLVHFEMANGTDYDVRGFPDSVSARQFAKATMAANPTGYERAFAMSSGAELFPPAPPGGGCGDDSGC